MSENLDNNMLVASGSREKKVLNEWGNYRLQGFEKQKSGNKNEKE